MSDADLPLPPYPIQPAMLPYGPVFPMTFGQILDRIWRLLRSHLAALTVVGLLPMAGFFGFYAVFLGALYSAGMFKYPSAQPHVPAMLWIFLPIELLFIPLMFLVYGLYYGASSYAALQADHGLTVRASGAFRHAWSKAGRYIWLMVLRSLIISGPIVVCVLLILAGAAAVGLLSKGNVNPAALFLLVPLGVLLYLGCLVYAIIMSLRLSLAFPACVHEELTAMQAIRRSGVLTQGAKGRIFLVLLVVYAISYAVVMVMYVVGLFVFAIGAVAGAGHFHLHSPVTIGIAVAAGLVVVALFFLWAALLLAAYSTAFAVLYRDQCLRRDGMLPGPVQAA